MNLDKFSQSLVGKNAEEIQQSLKYFLGLEVNDPYREQYLEQPQEMQDAHNKNLMNERIDTLISVIQTLSNYGDNATLRALGQGLAKDNIHRYLQNEIFCHFILPYIQYHAKKEKCHFDGRNEYAVKLCRALQNIIDSFTMRD